MALKDDILALPSTVGEGSAGHLGDHATLHAAAKDYETRLDALETQIVDLETRINTLSSTKAEKTVVENLTGQIMTVMGIASSALRRTKTN